ncbi:hypothetical protein AB4Z52_21180 [Rhizobium sp. 2YAF20]|uniref:hypothetical protein n=1 Tax=Rhizobium sp. 2YAF20 TaxID=3233027 RepID=UPI003F9E9CC0
MDRHEDAERNDANRPLANEQPWSVSDFARRYRLAKREENRLLMLYGPMAPFRDLLTTARRHLLTSQ